MQAVILAAGTGSRLEKVSGGLPKCLLPFGGKPLIVHQLEALADEGIGKVLIVVGHKAEEVRRAVGSRAEFIENPRFAETNSLYSLWLARDWVKGPFVLLNCDLLFPQEVLGRLLASGGNTLAFDSTSSKGLEQTKVAIKEGRVIDLGKDLQPELARGESLGLLCFDAAGCRALFSRADALVRGGSEKSWVIEAVRSACAEVSVRALNVADLPWAELDFPADLERARAEVWPEIEAGRWREAVRWRKTKWLAAAGLAALLLVAGWLASTTFTEKKPAWSTVAPAAARPVQISLPKGTQKWWEGAAGKPVKVLISGPVACRAETRLLMPPLASPQGYRYVVQVSIDGKPAAWEAHTADPDPQAGAAGMSVSGRGKTDFLVPAGTHTVEVGVLAGDSKDFLGRVRQLDMETAIEEREGK